MKIEETVETLQSSCLAPLFPELEGTVKEEKEGKTILKFKIKTPFSSKEPPLLGVIGRSRSVSFFIRNLSKTRDSKLIARVAHVNHLTSVPKVCWDPEDGEVYLEWTVLTDDNADISPLVFERIVASMLQVYYGEKRYFMMAELSVLVEKEVIDKSQAETLSKDVSAKIDAEFLPLIEEVLRG